LHRKAKNITIDRCWKLAEEVILKASKRKCAIILEDLQGLRRSGERTRWELEMFAYRKLQRSIKARP
jgi:IS605 OrfB family transposase